MPEVHVAAHFPHSVHTQHANKLNDLDEGCPPPPPMRRISSRCLMASFQDVINAPPPRLNSSLQPSRTRPNRAADKAVLGSSMGEELFQCVATNAKRGANTRDSTAEFPRSHGLHLNVHLSVQLPGSFPNDPTPSHVTTRSSGRCCKIQRRRRAWTLRHARLCVYALKGATSHNHECPSSTDSSSARKPEHLLNSP